MRSNEAETGLLRLLPPIRRARLWRLYAEDGRRFLDLWMDGGRSLLGAKGQGLGTSIKAAVDMGLLRPLPSVWEGRATRAVKLAFPGYAGALAFRNEERAVRELDSVLGRPAIILDSASREMGPEEADVLVLRPFGESLPRRPAALPRFALPLLPCPSALGCAFILFRDEAEAMGGELVPPAALACAAGALRELAAFAKGYGEQLWRRADRRLGPLFERKGPYLYPRCAEADYGVFFRRALEAGLLISPRFDLPSILPADFDDGELAALSKASAR